jgi:hypothetical protein
MKWFDPQGHGNTWVKVKFEIEIHEGANLKDVFLYEVHPFINKKKF